MKYSCLLTLRVLICACPLLSFGICLADEKWLACEARHTTNQIIDFDTKRSFYVYLNAEGKDAKILSTNGEVECPKERQKISIDVSEQEYSIIFGRESPDFPIDYPSSVCTLSVKRITGAFEYSSVFFVTEDFTRVVTHTGVCELLAEQPNLAPRL